MSYYGGGGAGGGGWAPPNSFLNQPPPGVPLPFFTTENQGFPPGMPPDFQQHYQYVAAPTVPVYEVPQPQAHQVPGPAGHHHQQQLQQQHPVSSLQPQQSDRHLERDQRRPEYNSPPRVNERRDRRQSPERGRSYRDDDDRYSRRKRSPSADDLAYRRQNTEGRGRPRDRDTRERSSESRDSLPPQVSSDKPKVDIDALLQDERLRNVLFAGISKATAKLEQSLQEGKGTKERSDFEPLEGKSQVFPSASTSQKPRSILKRNKDDDEVGGSKALSNLSALERTLQMLRGKGDMKSNPAPSDRSPQRHPPAQGALGQLSAYDDGNNEERYLYDKEKISKEKQTATDGSAHGTQPFWSVPSKLETSKRESDSFDAKEKMFEEWRQSIGKQSDSKSSQREMLREGQSKTDIRPSIRKRDMQIGSGEVDNQEELDSTVQNILQSIGFNFDLSRRMQELARKKKRQEDEGNIVNATASFMDKGEMLAEELRASLLQSGSDLSSIDTLIKEARATSQGSRHRSPSSGIRDSSYGRDVEENQRSRKERFEREDEELRSRHLNQAKYKSNDQWERISPDFSPPQRFSPPRRRFKERDSLSPSDNYDDRSRRSGPGMSERFRDDGGRNEYFYPEKDFVDNPPSVPLLTSFSSRKNNEDLSGGLLKSMRVENFRVMSRPTNDEYENDDSYVETRRVILPAKTDRRDFSPRDRDFDSPVRTVTRKRSASPMPMPTSKDRKISPNFGAQDYDDYPRRKSPTILYPVRRPSDDHYSKTSSFSTDRIGSRDRSLSPVRSKFYSDTINTVDRKKSPLRRKSPSRQQSREIRREKSPIRHRSRSRNRSRSRSRNRSRSPHRRRSPPHRRRSRSPNRGRSKSPVRKRRSPGRRTSPLRVNRRSPPKRGGRSRSRERNRQISARSDHNRGRQAENTKNKQSKDLSKLSDQERQAHLQKMLDEKGQSNPTVLADKRKEVEPVQKESLSSKTEHKTPPNAANLEKLVDAVEELSSGLSVFKRIELLTKARVLSAEEQSKILANVTKRKSKLLTWRQELERLKKAQNELMRKNQRSGLGNNDPQLKVNNLSQLEIEKEIDRLSEPLFQVELQSNVEQSLKTIRNKFQKAIDSSQSTQKAKTDKSQAPKSSTEPALKGKESSTEAESGKDSAGQTSWTSVAVKEEALPEIKDGKGKRDRGNEKRVEKSERSNAAPMKAKRNIYYEYLDSGNHWCRHCHVGCNALEQFFNHCHGNKHKSMISDIAKPWHDGRGDYKSNRKVGQAQTRRTKGSEMMFPVAGFFCTLCQKFCGDFGEAEDHLKSDSHYDKYLDFLRENPGYEKKLLLERSRASSDRRQIVSNSKKRETKPAPPPLPPLPPEPSDEKRGKKTKSHLRKRREEEEKEVGAHDNTESVDMDLDDEDERDDDKDVESKVPKLSGKKTSTSVTTILSSLPLPESSGGNSSVEMKSSQGDEVKSLGQFLTIAKDQNESQSQSKKTSKLPVIAAKPELDLSNIPIPQSVAPSDKMELGAIPLPPSAKMSTGDSVTSTVKSLQQVQDEEKRLIDEEKKMMGIDVDAEEEKPLAPVRRPPPLPQATGQVDQPNEKAEEDTVKDEVVKPKSLDSLFTKVKVSHIVNQKARQLRASEEKSEMEIRIQNEIKAKLEKEKQKLLMQKERKERKEKMLEEKKFEKKKNIWSDSSSEEETESEEEEEKIEMLEKDNSTNLDDINLPKTDEGIVGIADIPYPPSAVTSEPVSNESQNMITTHTVPVLGEVNLPPEESEIKQEFNEENVTQTVQSDATWSAHMSGVINNADLESQRDGQDIVNPSINMDVVKMEWGEGASQSSGKPPIEFCGPAPASEKISKDDNIVSMEEDSNVLPDVDTNISSVSVEISKDIAIKIETEATEEDSNVLPHTDSTNSFPPQDALKVIKPSPKGAKRKGKKPAAAKTAIAKALQSESDLLGVLFSSPETLSKQGQKKAQGAKNVTPKRATRLQRNTPQSQAQCDESDDIDIAFSMDDFVILSEVTEDDEESKGVESAQKEESGAENVQKEGDDALPPSNETIEEITKTDQESGLERKENEDSVQSGETNTEDLSAVMDVDIQKEEIKPVTGAQNSKGPRSGGRGKGKGRKGAGKRGATVIAEVSSSTDDVNAGQSEVKLIECTGTAMDEGTESPTSLEVSFDKDDSVGTLDDSATAVEEESTVPVTGRTRRSGRVTAAKSSPVKTAPGRQTRSRGKKNVSEVIEIEESASGDIDEPKVRTLRSRDSKNTENVEILRAEEENKETSTSTNEEMHSLQSEPEKEDAVSTSWEDLEFHNESMGLALHYEDRTENVDQGVEPTLKDDEESRIECEVPENSGMIGTNEEKESAIEEMPSFTLHQGMAETEGNDSDATITEDVDDSFDGAFQTEVFGELQTSSDGRSVSESQVTSLDVEPASLPTSSRPKDPPMSGVVTEMGASENMVMMMEEEEAQGLTDASEFESLPTAGLSLGLGEDSVPMEFAIVDEEGKPESQDSS